ncbi:MAG TPA: UbiA family prenyltransferase [Gemmatimonadaceae bacterium]|nr:UbiA family prenyltransferase [Gemmatimonadaceae bacterium]
MPVYVRTGDAPLSLRRSAPLLLVSVCTFIANDLDDAEKDRVNHPDRPLASGELAPTVAAIIYFLCLITTLLSIRLYIGATPMAFLYYATLTTWISYHYVVEYLPSIKAFYVATVSTLPVVIVAAFFANEITLRYVTVALFFFMLGRELCKDLPDRPGDPTSRLHSVNPRRVAVVAFVIELFGLTLLTLVVSNWFGAAVLGTMAMFVTIAGLCWFRWHRTLVALKLMQCTLFLGLCLLI